MYDMQIDFGTDPEYFIIKTDGTLVPAHKFFEDKHHKKRYSRGSVFRDGYAVEVNVMPDECRQTVTYSVQYTLRNLDKFLRERGCRLFVAPAVKIDLAKLRNAPKDVQMFGCDPSFCAYTGEAKIPSIDGRTHDRRYAGGHLHFSTTRDWMGRRPWLLERNPEQLADAAKLLDLYLGLPLTCIFHSLGQYTRRKYYGQAGEFRPQTYDNSAAGIEYRTPGPEVWNTAAIASFALGVGRKVLQNFHELRRKWDKKIEDDLRDAINTGAGRVRLLRRLQGFYNPGIVSELQQKIHNRRLVLLSETNGEVQNGYGDWALEHLKPNKVVEIAEN